MFTDRLRAMLRSSGQSPPDRPVLRRAESLPEQTEFAPRHSNGLDQFFAYIKGESGLTLLDLGGVNQATVTFIANLGHKLYSQDFLLNLNFSVNGSVNEAMRPEQIEAFLDENLDFPEHTFDGALIWDVLEHLDPVLLAATVERLSKIVKPGSYLLAMFNSQEKTDSVAVHAFRIQDSRTLLVATRGRHKPLHVFNNRNLEKLFGGFDSLKFFLTREKLREVIIKR